MGSYKYSEIRKLDSGYLDTVADILEEDEQWKRFMCLIPKNLADLSNENYEPKYDGQHIRLIENYVRDLRRPKMNCAKVMFSEWGSSGRIRPTVDTVQKLLLKGEMYKAADQIASKLGEPAPPRPPHGPAAEIVIDITHHLVDDSNTQADLNHFDTENRENLPVSELLNPAGRFNSSSDDTRKASTTYSDSHHHTQTTSQDSNEKSFNETIQSTNVIAFHYRDVEIMTNNFTSTHIGSGLFGDVFLGHHPGLGEIAVKKAKSTKLSSQITKMFQSEVKSLSMLQHRNIVSLIGISFDGVVPCIVCEYVDGGSLKQKIAEKVLNESQRIKIMSGTAEGLKYMHNFVKASSSTQPFTTQRAYFVHKDVKSPNILLTKDFIPKLCDLGLTENFDISLVQSDHINGTPAYMAPESSSGTITQKGDVYSYGIVMLEIITGKTVVVYENHEQMNIKEYVQKNILHGVITPLLDPVVDKWINGHSLYEIAVLCLNNERTLRPTMDEICIKLQKLNGNQN